MRDANAEDLRAFIESADTEAWACGEIDLWLYDPEVVYEDPILPEDAGRAIAATRG